MSANLDIVRSIYAGWERGDFSRNEWADPEIEFRFVSGPDPGSWTGVAGMSERWREWVNAWRDFRAVPEEYLVLDSDRVLVLVQNRGRGRTSELELVQQSVANLFELRCGKVTRLVVYFDRDRAFAELSLAVAHRQLEAVNRRDLDALMSMYAPDVVYDTSPHGLGVYEGAEAMRALIKDYWDAFEDLTFELEELRDLGGGVMFHVVRQHARPVGSAQYVENHEAHVSEWVDGKIVRVAVYLDVDEGRSAAERLARARK